MPPRRSGSKPGSEHVVLTPRDLRLTADALMRQLPRAEMQVPDEPVTIEEILDSMGPGTDREKVSRLASSLAGTSNKSSRAYQSARRSIERYRESPPRAGKQRRGRVRRPLLPRIVKVSRRPRLDVHQALAVAMEASVIYVGQVKRMPAGGPQYIAAERLSRVRERLRGGDEIDAAIELLNAWVHSYGLNTEPVAQGVIGSIEWITVELA